ncbi:adenosylcobinamide-GDP ribazoletransferase [Methanosarcinales archaeon]|nr:MAG: adenosylcobinamide-GDP ribazoletransferase [Methanosarcinales archaeon]
MDAGMEKFFSSLSSCFTFLSTIPLGASSDGVGDAMRHIYLFPVCAVVIGLVAGGIGYAASYFFFHPVIIALFAFTALYALTGINHLDGLADLGDGLATHGDSRRKIGAMKDLAIGTGGVGLVVFGLIATYTAILSIAYIDPSSLLSALVVGEVCSKHAMLTVSLKARVIHDGMGSVTICHTTPVKYLISLGVTLIVCTILCEVQGLGALVVSTIAALLLRVTANRQFGGVSGDVIGAANEVARIAALVTLSGVFSWMHS